MGRQKSVSVGMELPLYKMFVNLGSIITLVWNDIILNIILILVFNANQFK